METKAKITVLTMLWLLAISMFSYAQPPLPPSLPFFDTIVVNDKLNVTILPHKNSSQVNSSIAGATLVLIKNHTLVLLPNNKVLKKNKEIPLIVYVETQYPVRKIVSLGNSSVNMAGADNELSIVSAKENSSQFIRGKNIYLTEVNDDSSGDVFIKGVNTNCLMITGKANGHLILKGKMHLQTLNLTGTGEVTLDHASGLNQIYNSGSKLKVTGVVSPSLIVLGKNAWISLRWIDSPVIRIRGIGGFAQLAGITNLLDLKITGNSHVDARFLRANTAAVYTTGCARADIWAIQNLYSFAADASNIYYFSPTKNITKEAYGSGTSLPMHEVPSSLLNF